MSQRDDRRPALLLVAALLFLGAMVALYFWAMRPPDLPPMPVAVAPVAAPARGVPGQSGISSRPAPAHRNTPTRTFTPPPVEDPTEAARDPLAPVELDIKVVDDSGDPIMRVPVRVANAKTGSNSRLVTDGQGAVSARVAPGVLLLVAERADGMLVSRSDPVEVDARQGGSWSVELVISSEPKGGLGVGIQPHADGIKVLSVHPNTPASDAGLVMGDLIVAVEGEETAEMPLPDFIARMTGLVGTKVLFDIVREDGTEERLQVERAIIERHAPGSRAN